MLPPTSFPVRPCPFSSRACSPASPAPAPECSQDQSFRDVAEGERREGGGGGGGEGGEGGRGGGGREGRREGGRRGREGGREGE